jgi:hypothetical protein
MRASGRLALVVSVGTLLVACAAPTGPPQGAPPGRAGPPGAGPTGTATATGPTPSATPGPTPPATRRPSASARPPGGWRPFAAGSPWNTRIAANPAVDPNSATLIADLAVSSPWPFFGINIDGFSIPVYYATSSTPRVRVEAELGGSGFPGRNGMDGAAMVPIPAGAKPDPQSDRHLVIVSADRRTSWDFFGARNTNGLWTCQLCATTNLTGSGVRPLKEGNPTWYTSHGARACGLPLLAGLIRPEEIRSGRIDHALVIAYPHIRAGRYTSPASTAQARIGDEAVSTRGIPCGGRVQLDPSLNLDRLGLSRSGKIVARALQEYGAYVGDYSGAISLYADNSPAARSAWNGGLLDSYELREKVALTSLRVLRLGPVYDDHNG